VVKLILNFSRCPLCLSTKNNYFLFFGVGGGVGGHFKTMVCREAYAWLGALPSVWNNRRDFTWDVDYIRL
jgi:hypothetical protein